jgi:hypothetical protein
MQDLRLGHAICSALDCISTLISVDTLKFWRTLNDARPGRADYSCIAIHRMTAFL